MHTPWKGSPSACIPCCHQAWQEVEFTDKDIATVSLIGPEGWEDLSGFCKYLDILLQAEKDLMVQLVRWCNLNKIPLIMGIDSNTQTESWGSAELHDRGLALEGSLCHAVCQFKTKVNSNTVIDLT